MSLTAMKQEVLVFERGQWRHLGAKETAVRERWGISLTQYLQILNALLDNPDAYAADPMLIKRLRRLREHRQRQRTG